MAGELKARTAFWPVLFVIFLSAIVFAFGVFIASANDAEGSSKFFNSECDNGNRVYYSRYSNSFLVLAQDPTCSVVPTPTQPSATRSPVPVPTSLYPEVPNDPTPKPTATNASSQP